MTTLTLIRPPRPNSGSEPKDFKAGRWWRDAPFSDGAGRSTLVPARQPVDAPTMPQCGNSSSHGVTAHALDLGLGTFSGIRRENVENLDEKREPDGDIEECSLNMEARTIGH